MKYPVYNQEGKETGEVNLPKDIFEVPLNADLVHQVAISQTANKRQVSAHTKDRGAVRGGGRKPWRQKGTGRARVGSIRSPLWRGGGVTGGPTNEKVYEKTIPTKMRRKALFMALSQKAKNNLLIVLDKLEMENPKTKMMVEIIKKLPGSKESRLITALNGDKKVFLSARNITKTRVAEARNLNVADVLNYKYLIVSKDGIKDIEKTFARQKSE
ncbi:MAG: 50S ribosomal protein L4 [Candidatus Staskawiczbacteria bacterium RIFCSPLOWO2_01_FULL_40_39]|uniref:Large ribosomal subunit protein uL4 n=1 Tax=Candidatus Staskawiczbacteria bacterium RIFCSPHIGHO2_01_FULL_39_25 TaxID=1802202 RepID=A0A1G2HQ43_9BACT|nr:MAG: 50S ribosomal protein L4 [Candidatus Staskawiczbacteria bacterium RIFCSPHIGHO2_01_FULL_39_25]OGZ72652.1 MAG: 50S ribosomal protein L4 [Candidatus Staskawiczbacteria bacterium RIFCSPLOWO2_01_FULL_40_39]OGZ76695.1 MAG: 50S ribosomal protein L4 [Candidatus Staskawiczbacteria bacterium RIFCSPLOWO2_02_FULL_39_8]